MARVRRIVAGCGFKTLADIMPEAVQMFLRSLRKSDDLVIAPTTTIPGTGCLLQLVRDH